MAEAQATEKKVDYLEHPASIAYKGIRITPAGFAEASGYYRNHATLSDLGTPFQSIPLEGYANGTYPNTESGTNPHMSEFGFSARNSRFAFRLDADPSQNAKLASYFEMDFFGTTPTSNPNQSTSYSPRIRQAWGRVKFSDGWTITGGQMWSLITLNRKGTDADNTNVWIPNTIDPQYSVGYDWGRFTEMRVSKTIGDQFSLAVGLGEPSTLPLSVNNTTGGIAGLAGVGSGNDGNSVVTSCSSSTNATTLATTTTCTNSPLYSTNLAPDMIAKLAYDSKFGHFEVKGVGRFVQDRVIPTAKLAGYNNNDVSGGVGGGTIIPIVHKKVDFIFQGLWGKGISRYQDAGQYDYVVQTANPGNVGNLQPIKSFSALGGFETHPTRKTELDMLFGEEYYYRTTYPTNATAVLANPATTPTFAGYGNPGATNVGCYYENLGQYQQTNPTATSLPSCTGNNRNVWNAKIYAYYDVFRGPHGTLRYGVEYDYDYRNTWSGTGGLPKGQPGSAPVGNDNTAFTTMRYIFP